MSSFKYIGLFLRLRYIVPATAVGGYYSAKRKIEEIKSSLPDMPDFLKDLQVSERLLQLKDYIDAEYTAAKREIDKRKFVEREVTSVVKPVSKEISDNLRKNNNNNNNDEIIGLRREVEKLKKENRELRTVLRYPGDNDSGDNTNRFKRKIKKSLIEIYSELLDELSGYDSSYKMHDHLPKVVVVGDQSSGKTSVLEMIAGARIFPRGAGEMMTRAPVQVTLSEGPYHIARFKDSPIEFDLTKESELANLRREIEERMCRSVRGGKTVSNQVISLSIQGPGIQRMVLVDLPGIISTVTNELAPDTKDCIKKMVVEYMSNPNAIILCIQDGSIDAERSIFTDMVREMDDAGRRTILVLTKVDIAEKTHVNPSKIKKILDGELFPMKALGYYAVVAGDSGKNTDIQQIRDHEENFFLTSSLVEKGIISSRQCSTRNLSSKVSECFWSMVKESVEQQADAYKATLLNLEAEWQRNFPHTRQLTRDELFYNARNELLDEVAQLSRISTRDWDQIIVKQLWEKIHDHVLERLYFPAAYYRDRFDSKVDMDLNRWIESNELPKLAVEVARESIKKQFIDHLFANENKKLSSRVGKKADEDRTIYQDLKRAVLNDALDRYQWKNQALEILRVVQLEAVSKKITLTKENWTKAITFLEDSLQDYIRSTDEQLSQLTGHGFTQRWLKWQKTTPEQHMNQVIRNEFDRLLTNRLMGEISADGESQISTDKLSDTDLIAIKRNLESQGLESFSNETIQNVWSPYFRHQFLLSEIGRARDCTKMFHFYENDLTCQTDCNHVLFFYRIKRLLEFTANSLRRQFLESELRRINKEIVDVLDEYGEDDFAKSKLISGKRVELAEELVKVRQIQDKLDEFITALNQEESTPSFSYNK